MQLKLWKRARLISLANRNIATIVFLLLTTNCFSQSFFTWIDDDAASVEGIKSVHQIAEELDIKVCYGVVADRILKNVSIRDSLLQYQDEGHQICNHSLTHGNIWKNPTQDAIEHELSESTEILDSLGFRNCDYLIYPFGRFSAEVREWMLPLVSKFYKMAFDARGGSCNLNNYNRYYVHRFPIRKHDNISIVKHEIDKASEHGEWIIFMTHSSMERDFSIEYVSEVMDYCKAKGMENLTVQEAYDKLSANGQLKEGKTKDWTSVYEICYLLYMHLWWVVIAIATFFGLMMVLFRHLKK